MKGKIFFSLVFLVLFVSDVKPSGFKLGYVVAPNGLVLRSHPDPSADKIDVIPYMSKILIIDETKNYSDIDGAISHWLSVKYKDQPGYVFGGFVSYIEPKMRNESCSELLKKHYSCAEKGLCVYNDKLHLTQSVDEFVSYAGTSYKKIDWRGSDFYIYENFEVYVSNSFSKKPQSIFCFEYQVLKVQFTLQDICQSLGSPRIWYNNHDAKWIIEYKFSNSILKFMTPDLNAYIDSIQCSKL